jgi:ribosomal protein S18 acetylase RimI-like enzyme
VKILSENEIRQLPKILGRFLPRSAVPYNILQLHLQSRHNPNHLNAKFYGYYPFKEEQPIFLVIILEKTYEETEIIVFTSDSCGGTKEALDAFEKLVNWNKLNTFASTNGPITQRIKELCLKNGKILETIPCKFNVMNCDKIDEKYLQKQEELLRENKGTVVASLRREDVKLVTANWKFSREETDKELIDLIDKIASTGIYIDSELISWMLLNQIGTMSALHTMEQHRGKGYAEIVARNVTKAAKEIGLIPSVEMEPYNTSSFRLFSKIGYEFAFESEWITYSPK